METLEPATPSSSLTAATSNSQNQSLTPSPLPPSVSRLWRPAAQRNLRNQWSKLAAYRQQWASSSSAGKSHATSLVNAYLSQIYMPSMELGALNDIPGIREKACQKLYKQQELHGRKLLSSYKDMVTVVTHLVKTSKSMRCYLKGTSSSPLVQFSGCSEDKSDSGDGGGIPVFVFWPISWFVLMVVENAYRSSENSKSVLSQNRDEKLAEELILMLAQELILKRLLVVELLSVGCEGKVVNGYDWSDELYPGEFDDLSMCNLLSGETCEPVHPRLQIQKSNILAAPSNQQPNEDVMQSLDMDAKSFELQVYLTTWLAEVNIDTDRVDEIFAVIGEEMHVTL
ncbi:hypothetical protein FEM48_Zijuj05G0130900 [Ziziphus jujuba var. spinosa]|uniref:Uncharacterized protein n=1 Tax=Ziziphus jujuba var. spinosa TaxID=714518 RepID=A0A978VF00_ZIZJJ|nr:hypothetical protein FEM48_Zijuj05G0130900 [Ziziphus jujuba var. spinosa]